MNTRNRLTLMPCQVTSLLGTIRTSEDAAEQLVCAEQLAYFASHAESTFGNQKALFDPNKLLIQTLKSCPIVQL